MKCPNRWQAVTPEEVKQECLHLGMKLSDSDQITELVTRRQQGKTSIFPRAAIKVLSLSLLCKS